MNGLFPQFRIIDNCEARDLDCTWSNVRTPTPESGPASCLLDLPWGGTRIKHWVVQRNYTWMKIVLKV